MNVQEGEIYERYTLVDDTSFQGWMYERRKVTGVSQGYVLYELLPPTNLPDGTIVESEPIIKQVSKKDWKKWARLARKDPASTCRARAECAQPRKKSLAEISREARRCFGFKPQGDDGSTRRSRYSRDFEEYDDGMRY